MAEARRTVAGTREAFDLLSKSLSDPARKDTWKQAVVLLAFTANPKAFPVLREFLFSDLSDPKTGKVSSEVYQAKARVPYSMGVLLKLLNETGSGGLVTEQIRTFLMQRSRPRQDSWKEINWRTEEYEEPGSMYLDLSLSCIRAIGVSRDPKAVAHLGWLLDHLREQKKTMQGRTPDALSKEGYPKGLANRKFFEQIESEIVQAQLSGKSR